MDCLPTARLLTTAKTVHIKNCQRPFKNTSEKGWAIYYGLNFQSLMPAGNSEDYWEQRLCQDQLSIFMNPSIISFAAPVSEERGTQTPAVLNTKDLFQTKHLHSYSENYWGWNWLCCSEATWPWHEPPLTSTWHCCLSPASTHFLSTSLSRVYDMGLIVATSPCKTLRKKWELKLQSSRVCLESHLPGEWAETCLIWNVLRRSWCKSSDFGFVFAEVTWLHPLCKAAFSCCCSLFQVSLWVA